MRRGAVLAMFKGISANSMKITCVAYMSRSRAKNSQAEYNRLFRAAVQNGLNIQILYGEDGKIKSVSTTDKREAKSETDLTPDDELERWRRKKGDAS